MWDQLCKRASISSALAGVLVACGYPPLHLWWISLPILAVFLALLFEAPNWRSSAWRGWLFGWAHLTVANNWIATAFTHQAKMPEILGWFAVPLLCVYLAIYPAMAALLARLLVPAKAQARGRFLAFCLVFAGAWIVFEWIRSWAFSGYPWPPLGLLVLGAWGRQGLAFVLPWVGTYALSGLVLLFAAWLVQGVRAGRPGQVAVPVGLLVFAMHIMGPPPLRESPVAFTLVQPLIPQEDINDGSKFEEQFARLADLSAAGTGDSRLVLWPESAIPDYLESGYPQRYYDRMTALNPVTGRGDPEFAKARIASIIGEQSALLTGVVNLDIEAVEGRRTAVSARNSVIAMNGEGAITAQYAKSHLVPYGEYLPIRSVLEPLGLSRLVAGSIDYIPGPGPRTLDLGTHGKAGVQICYEIVFSGQVVDPSNRPDYLFNPSNDGWFGAWGPPQHLAQARMRALEEGLPVLRSTTTGISAVVDANGIVRQHIGMGEAAALRGQVPQARAPTLFARTGNALPLAWAVLLLVIGLCLPRLLALVKSRS